MKRVIACIFTALLLVACGDSQRTPPDSAQEQPFAAPGDMPDEMREAELGDLPKLDTLQGFADLPAIEREIFRETVALQIPFYDKMERWASQAHRVDDGRQASEMLRRYIELQNDFGKGMHELDEKYKDRIEPNYAGTEMFVRTLDNYMESPQMQRRIEFITHAYISLIQRFRDDPACQAVLSDISRMARESED